MRLNSTSVTMLSSTLDTPCGHHHRRGHSFQSIGTRRHQDMNLVQFNLAFIRNRALAGRKDRKLYSCVSSSCDPVTHHWLLAQHNHRISVHKPSYVRVVSHFTIPPYLALPFRIGQNKSLNQHIAHTSFIVVVGCSR